MGDDVRLIPDGCDYLLRGSLPLAPAAAAADTITVPARAADGSAVTVEVARDARGLTIAGDPPVAELRNVAVLATAVALRR